MDASDSCPGKSTVRWILLGSALGIYSSEREALRQDRRRCWECNSNHSLSQTHGESTVARTTFQHYRPTCQDSVCLHWWPIGCWAAWEGGITSLQWLCAMKQSLMFLAVESCLLVSTLQLGQLQWCTPSLIGFWVVYYSVHGSGIKLDYKDHGIQKEGFRGDKIINGEHVSFF